MAGLFDDLALGGDGVIKAANEGAVVAPGVGAQTVARGLHEAFVVFVSIVFEHLQLLLHIALGRDELTQAAGSVVGAGLGEIEKRLEMKASSHGRVVSLFGMAPDRVHLSRSAQAVAAHLSWQSAACHVAAENTWASFCRAPS